MMTPLGRLLLRGWLDFNALAARYQRSALLSAIYVILLVPGALVARFGSDPLRRTVRPGSSAWIARPREDPSLESMKRQY